MLQVLHPLFYAPPPVLRLVFTDFSTLVKYLLGRSRLWFFFRDLILDDLKVRAISLDDLPVDVVGRQLYFALHI